MHTSDEDYLIIDDAEKKTVRKAAKERSMCLAVESRKTIRIRLDNFYRRSHCCEEFVA
jgi:hypothetical protein